MQTHFPECTNFPLFDGRKYRQFLRISFENSLTYQNMLLSSGFKDSKTDTQNILQYKVQSLRMIIRHRSDAKLDSILRIRQKENELLSVLWLTPHRLPKVCFCLFSSIVAVIVVGFDIKACCLHSNLREHIRRYAALFTTVRHQNRHNRRYHMLIGLKCLHEVYENSLREFVALFFRCV